ncbi:MAG: hypothetical protein GY737_20650, partial [Desulfobacteraceae bacterium]|nr:hypothetical protein [Desulfobacteraceae bacterium]
TMDILMHGTRPADRGPVASIMQIATLSGEVVLIDLFAFRLALGGRGRGKTATFTPGGGMGRHLPYGGRELGPGRPDQGRGEGFELPEQLAYLLASQVLVFFGASSDRQMLERLYGLNHLKAAHYEKWRIADLQGWFSANPGTGGRGLSRNATGGQVGLAAMWGDCCSDQSARYQKEMADQMLTAGDGYLKGVALASVPRQRLVTDAALVSTAYLIKDVTYLVYLAFYGLFTFNPPSTLDAGVTELRKVLLAFLKEKHRRFLLGADAMADELQQYHAL